MALVRRVDVMGPAAVGRAVVAPQGNPPTAPAQGPPPPGAPFQGAALQGAPLQGPAAGADATPQSLASAVPTWAGNIEAAAVASKGAGLGTIAFSFLLVALGTAVAYALQRWGNHAVPFRIG